MIKARVNIEMAGKSYKPGRIIREPLSAGEMEFLKSHGFVLDESLEQADTGDGDPFNHGADAENDFSGIRNPLEHMGGESEYKDEAALLKLSKDELVEYAGRIGLELDPKMFHPDMVDAILNYTEEQMAAEE